MNVSKKKEFCLFLDSIIENAPKDISANEIWMPLNLYQLVKKKSHNGFKLFASQFLTNNQVVIGSYFHDEQIN